MNLVKTIYLVRHGSTAANQADILQGRVDNRLNEKGRQEAAALSSRLSNYNLDLIFHSPLTRAMETAEIINRNRQVPMTEVEGFAEIDLGDWEGRKYTEVITEEAEEYHHWLSSPGRAIPGGESFKQVSLRVQSGVSDILNSPHRDIMIVGHATVNRAILGHLLKVNLEAVRLFRVRNCSLSAFLVYQFGTQPIKNRIVLDVWDDTSHLEG